MIRFEGFEHFITITSADAFILGVMFQALHFPLHLHHCWDKRFAHVRFYRHNFLNAIHRQERPVVLKVHMLLNSYPG